MLDDKNLFNFEDDDSVNVNSIGAEDDADLWAVDDLESENYEYLEEDSAQLQSYDLNGDGVEDVLVYEEDLNGDFVADASSVAIDINGDGIIDTVSYTEDIDFDGIADIEQHQVDFDFDGQTDYTETKVFMNDENGHSNEFFMTATDLDNDGVADEFNMEFRESEPMNAPTGDDSPLDVDNDSDFSDYSEEDDSDFSDYSEEDDSDFSDYIEEDDSDFSDYTEEDDSDFSDYADEDDNDYYEYGEYEDDTVLNLPTVDYDGDADNSTLYEDLERFDPADADLEGIIGNPEEVLDLWESQGSTSRCALYAQKFVIEEYLGEEIDIDELADFATENGWFTEDGGTPVIYMDKLLDHYNVPNETSFDNSIEDIAESLNEGHRVIVSVDADEYWFDENDSVYAPDGINHAIEIIGINNSDPENPTVIVNDSGVPEGAGLEIPMETFLDAWEDGSNFMIECM